MDNDGIKSAKDSGGRLESRKDQRQIDLSAAMYRAIRVGIIVAAIIVALTDVCLGDKRTEVLMCKRMVIEIAMNNCKGPRIKRDTDNIDLEKLDRETTKMAIVDSSQVPGHEAGTKQEKRQFYQGGGGFGGSGFGGFGGPGIGGYGVPGFGDYGGPGVNIESQNFHEKEISLPGLNFETKDSTMFEESIRPSFFPGFRHADPVVGLRHAESGELLGFDISEEDFEDLYEELAERMPRKSKDYNWKSFSQNVIKCCQNLTACREDPSQIPCKGF